MNKPFYFRLNPADLLAELIQLPTDAERGAWVTQLAAGLVRGVSELEYANKLFDEAAEFRKKNSEKGKLGMAKRWHSKTIVEDNRTITNDNRTIVELNQTVTSSSSSNSNIKTKASTNKAASETETVPYAEIINGMNEILGTKYQVKSESTRSLIRARLAEGYSVADFLMVCRNMKGRWGLDEKMVQYLRPETLFCASKMGGYLNTKTISVKAEQERLVY